MQAVIIPYDTGLVAPQTGPGVPDSPGGQNPRPSQGGSVSRIAGSHFCCHSHREPGVQITMHQGKTEAR